MRTRVRRWVRRWGWRLHLIAYCERCDGSMAEAEARGYEFAPDRWRFHRRHERAENSETRTTPLYPGGRR